MYDAIEKAIKTKHEPFKKDSYPVFIENINCDRVIFENVRFNRNYINRHKIIYGGLSLQQCLVFDDLTIDGIQFDLSNIDYKDISFRDSRFISGIRIKNVRIDNSSDNVISFEDSRIDGDISIKHSSLGKTKLFLFQTILGNYVSGDNPEPVRLEKDNKISISEVDLDLDSFINMLDIEMFAGSLELVGLKTIPRTDIMFYPIILQKKDKKNDEENAKCPSTELIISNSTVEEDIIVGNIERFELNNVILSARIIENPKGLMPDIRYRSKTRGLKGTMIKSRLLLASYNSLYKIKKGHSLDTKIVKEKPDIPINKALEFIQLKENFANTGKYDFEDEALLLYMELKPYIDKYNVGKKGKKSWWYQFLYKILYATGKYGVSPRRTFCSIILTWILFAFIYLGVMLFKGGNIVDLGTEINNYNLVFKAFVYSMDQVVPFTSTYNTPYFFVMGLSVLERFIGLFLIGYFSIAVVRKTQR